MGSQRIVTRLSEFTFTVTFYGPGKQVPSLPPSVSGSGLREMTSWAWWSPWSSLLRWFWNSLSFGVVSGSGGRLCLAASCCLGTPEAWSTAHSCQPA